MAGPNEGFRDDSDGLQIEWAEETPWGLDLLTDTRVDPEEDTKEFPIGEGVLRSRDEEAPTTKMIRPPGQSLHDSLDDTRNLMRFMTSALLEPTVDTTVTDEEKPRKLFRRKTKTTGYKLMVDPSLRRFQEDSRYGRIIRPEVFEELTRLTKKHLPEVLRQIIQANGLNPKSLRIDNLGRVVIPPRRRLWVKRGRLPTFRRKKEARQVLNLNGDIRRRFLSATRPALRELAERIGHGYDIHPDLVQLFRNRFLILGKVNEGNHSKIFLARDLENDRLVSLKIIFFKPYFTEEILEMIPAKKYAAPFPFQRAYFDRESRIRERLNHPGVASFIAADHTENGGYIAMEWCDGDNLFNYMDAEPLPIHGEVDEQKELKGIGVLELAAKLGSIIHQLHSDRPQVIHRDIKPQNILVRNGVDVELTDFGISQDNETPDQKIDPSEASGPSFSEAFASPETFENIPYDASVDIYGLGAVLYYALTGKAPVGDFKPGQVSTSTETSIRIMMSRLRRKLPPAPHEVRPEVPLELSELVMSCLVEPEDRPKALEVVEAAIRMRKEWYPELYDDRDDEDNGLDEELYWSDDVPEEDGRLIRV